MNDRFDRNTFESVEFLIESTEAPKIKAGGSSSSNILNRFFSALGQDISLLATRANILASRSNRIEKGSAEQGSALQAQFVALSSRVDSASSYTQILADMYSTFYIANGSETSVEFDYRFGQATLSTLGTTDLLLQTDVYGNNYISPEVQFSYSTVPAASIASLSIASFITDPDGIFMLKEEQTWVKDTDVGQTKGYVRIKAPLQFRGLSPNVIELWPFPAFSTKLRKVSYRRANDPEDTWTHLDLSYLPNYSTASGLVNYFGPVRLHLDNVPISELVIEIDVTGSDVWGFKKIKVYHREYSSVGNFTVEDPYSRTVGNITLRGKDTALLSTFTNAKIANQAVVYMSSTDSAVTPVITGVIMDIL
jgi:hypothetical protein